MRGERGQVVIIVVVFLLALLGLGALTVDAGSWFRDDRRLQSGGDAAALAGAYSLATGGNGVDAANANGTQNATPLSSAVVSTRANPNDTITVTAEHDSTSFLAGLFGIPSSQRHAVATAQVFNLTQTDHVVPFAVPQTLAQNWASGSTVTLTFDNSSSGSSGNFGLLSLCGATPGDIANCLTNGSSSQVGLGPQSIISTGNKWNSNAVQTALQTLQDSGKPVLVPVFAPPVLGSGSNAQYNIVGFASFVVTGHHVSGQVSTITGHFIAMVWQGTSGGGGCFCGASTISLTQ